MLAVAEEDRAEVAAREHGQSGYVACAGSSSTYRQTGPPAQLYQRLHHFFTIASLNHVARMTSRSATHCGGASGKSPKPSTTAA